MRGSTTASLRRLGQACLRALERHRTCTLWEPLVPADSDADSGKLRVENLEASVTGIEVELLLVPGRTGHQSSGGQGLKIAKKNLTS